MNIEEIKERDYGYADELLCVVAAHLPMGNRPLAVAVEKLALMLSAAIYDLHGGSGDVHKDLVICQCQNAINTLRDGRNLPRPAMIKLLTWAAQEMRNGQA